jgi:hypothetical protein
MRRWWRMGGGGGAIVVGMIVVVVVCAVVVMIAVAVVALVQGGHRPGNLQRLFLSDQNDISPSLLGVTTGTPRSAVARTIAPRARACNRSRRMSD